MIQLRLRPGRRHRVLQGHPWVFSNQLTAVPDDLTPGDPVEVLDSQGGFVGLGYGHPNTLIAARILERRDGVPVDSDWLGDRLDAALQLRRRVCANRSGFRWVHAEADGLPGLVIDRFEDERGARAVLSANTAGMERWREALESLLEGRFGLRGAVWKCEGRGRQREGLTPRVEPAFGDTADWLLDDDGVLVGFDPVGGQKTGLFLDMWENRRRMVPALARGRALDLFSYVGQWGLHMAAAGADEVLCVDRSAAAIEQVRANAARNSLEVEAIAGDVKAFLDGQDDGSFDSVVCDPPAFIQSRKDVDAGMRGYGGLYANALRKVRPGGFAVVASCSHHLDDERFAEVIGRAAKSAKRPVTVLVRGDQAPCHPVPLSLPEARYLKCWLLRVG